MRYYLYVAKGSCGEVRSMLILAKELNKISEEAQQTLTYLAEEVSKIISGLIKSIST
jgi:four helix bundle protein